MNRLLCQRRLFGSLAPAARAELHRALQQIIRATADEAV
jgi:hypothetical protein